jgi:hypothetical protein
MASDKICATVLILVIANLSLKTQHLEQLFIELFANWKIRARTASRSSRRTMMLETAAQRNQADHPLTLRRILGGRQHLLTM